MSCFKKTGLTGTSYKGCKSPCWWWWSNCDPSKKDPVVTAAWVSGQHCLDSKICLWKIKTSYKTKPNQRKESGEKNSLKILRRLRISSQGNRSFPADLYLIADLYLSLLSSIQFHSLIPSYVADHLLWSPLHSCLHLQYTQT